MTQDPNSAANAPQPARRHETTDADKEKARKWFKHAKAVSESKNYDYAVELYVNGLALWPDAVEEGLRMLRVVATARKLNGGKAAGFLEVKKRSMHGKDTLKNLNNAIYLFGMDPTNSSHMETILHSAVKARLDSVVHWVAPIIVEALSSEKKQSEKRYGDLCQSMDAGAEQSIVMGEFQTTVDILQATLRTAQIWTQHYPASANASKAYSDASSKQTIVKGRFSSGDGFRDSVKDASAQADLRDKDSAYQSDIRVADLVTKARKEWETHRDVPAKLLNLVELILKREEDEPENEAIGLLDAEFADSNNYTLKSKSDDIRMRQMKRHVRRIATKLKADPTNEDVRRLYAKYLSKQARTEIEIYRERQAQYPSDMRIRFELGVRLFKGKQFDEAIPLFQQAQTDGRHRNESRLYLGRCFHEKGFPAQAVDTLRTALEAVESKADETAKELHYWLARSLEADGQAGEARKTYGHLIQLDYNFRDARQRLEALSSSGGHS